MKCGQDSSRGLASRKTRGIPLRSRDHWCLPPFSAPAQTLDSPLDPQGQWPHPPRRTRTPATQVPDNLRRPHSYPPRQHRTQPLPRPCHLGRLTHGSPLRGGYLLSGQIHLLSATNHCLACAVQLTSPRSRRNQSSCSTSIVAPPFTEGRERGAA